MNVVLNNKFDTSMLSANLKTENTEKSYMAGSKKYLPPASEKYIDAEDLSASTFRHSAVT